MKLEYRLIASFSNNRGGKRRNACVSIDRLDRLTYEEVLEIDDLVNERYFVSIVRDPSELVF
jgi:hypothetical protein